MTKTSKELLDGLKAKLRQFGDGVARYGETEDDSFMVRDLGRWEADEGDDDEEDNDFQVLTELSYLSIKKIVTDYNKSNECNIDFCTCEKNYIEFTI